MGKHKKEPFVVREALLPKEEGGFLQRWYVYREFLPVDAINQFLHRKSGRSPGTGKTYAYSLASWLNFLMMRDIEHHEAKRSDIDAFVEYLAYGMHCEVKVLALTSDITYGTLSRVITAIQGFYRWFDGHVDVFIPPSPSSSPKSETRARNKAKTSFLYGQIYDVPIDEVVELEKMRLKPSGYKKHWLTAKEKGSILRSLRTARDRAVFMLLCEGMRIDEVLSIKFSAYDNGELTVKPSRSKGYLEGYEDKLRIIAFHDDRTAQYLDQYIQTERADIETELNEFLEPLFVNLKKHDGAYGKAVSYRNYWGVLKRAVERAGIDPTEIATHAGRRTFVQEKLEEGENPEIIRQMVGWASLSPLDSYRNLHSKSIIKNAAEARRKDWPERQF